MGMVTISVDINLNGDGSAEQTADLARADNTLEGLPDLLSRVCAERCVQDIQWGGRLHDDQHAPADWELFLQQHLGRLLDSEGEPESDYPDRLIKIAALALAARQSWDRLNAPGEAGEAIEAIPPTMDDVVGEQIAAGSEEG